MGIGIAAPLGIFPLTGIFLNVMWGGGGFQLPNKKVVVYYLGMTENVHVGTNSDVTSAAAFVHKYVLDEIN